MDQAVQRLQRSVPAAVTAFYSLPVPSFGSPFTGPFVMIELTELSLTASMSASFAMLCKLPYDLLTWKALEAQELLRC